jgi:hypothetical protein
MYPLRLCPNKCRDTSTVFDFGTSRDFVLKFLVYPLLINIPISKLYEYIPSLVETCGVCVSSIIIH